MKLLATCLLLTLTASAFAQYRPNRDRDAGRRDEKCYKCFAGDKTHGPAGNIGWFGYDERRSSAEREAMWKCESSSDYPRTCEIKRCSANGNGC